MEIPPVDLIRKYFGLYVSVLGAVVKLERLFPDSQLTSWFRDRARNAEVGGAEYSQHRLGFAFDVVTAEPERFAATARAYGFTAVQEGSHVHLQVFPAGVLPHDIFTV